MSLDVEISQSTDTGSKYPAMSTGLHEAVIAELRDLGKLSFQGGPGKQTYVARFVNAKGEQASRFYTPSLFEKSKLAIDLKALDGAVPKTFILSSLIGRQVSVLVKKGINKKGFPTSKVTDVMPPSAGQQIPLS